MLFMYFVHNYFLNDNHYFEIVYMISSKMHQVKWVILSKFVKKIFTIHTPPLSLGNLKKEVSNIKKNHI